MNVWQTATVLATAACIAVAAAVPAAADDDLFLGVLSDQQYYGRLGPKVLLAEGYKVCDLIAGGMDQMDVIDVVESDLSVSTYSAGFIVGAASSGLGC